MPKCNIARYLIGGAALLIVLVNSPAATAQRVTVFAAVSVSEALDEAARRFSRSNRVGVVASYAASSALAKQIENGAPADIFLSADVDWMDYLETRRLLRIGTRTNLLRNRLVLIAPGAGNVQIDANAGLQMTKLLGSGRLAIADPDSVPAGKYGKAALEYLGVWNDLKSKLARAENVRGALNFVARGEAPLGIVYRSDALAENKVRIVAEFAADSHPAIIYPVAVIASSRQPAAPAFANYLKSTEARAIFEKYGFSMHP
jgi:molybdate transport system substrate-binding protein